jgi:hypothetical protein
MTAENSAGPIACDFHQIPADRRGPLLARLRTLFRRVVRVRALPNGFALEFPGEPGMATALSEIIEYDRLCCPFIRHALLDEPWGGNLTLELTGTDEVRDFLPGELRTFLPPEIDVPSNGTR